MRHSHMNPHSDQILRATGDSIILYHKPPEPISFISQIFYDYSVNKLDFIPVK